MRAQSGQAYILVSEAPVLPILRSSERALHLECFLSSQLAVYDSLFCLIHFNRVCTFLDFPEAILRYHRRNRVVHNRLLIIALVEYGV